MHTQGCYNALVEHLTSINLRDFDENVERFGIEVVFQRLKNYVIEHQLSFEPSLDSDEESFFGEIATNYNDVHIISDNEFQEELVGENNLVIVSSPEIIEVSFESSESYVPATQPPDVLIISNDSKEHQFEPMEVE